MLLLQHTSFFLKILGRLTVIPIILNNNNRSRVMTYSFAQGWHRALHTINFELRMCTSQQEKKQINAVSAYY